MEFNIKEERVTRSAILVSIDRIVETYPMIPVAQHLRAILRAKGGKDSFEWTNKELLTKLEKYVNELEDSPPQLWQED